MNQLIELLLRNPWLALVLLAWVASAVSGARRQAQRGAPTGRSVTPPAPPSERPARAPLPPPGQAPAAPARAAGRLAPADVAREMRRILGLDPPAPAARPAPAPRPKEAPAPRAPAAAKPVAVEDRDLGQLASRVDPHVGERLAQRQAPASGAVGRTELGTLGGRHPRRRRRGAQDGRLVDLGDLRRAFVLREILDAPLALRPHDWR